MDLRGKLKDELKQSTGPNSRVFYQNQSFAETAVNALEQRTLLDVDSEPYDHVYFSINDMFTYCVNVNCFHLDGIHVIRVSSVHWVDNNFCS
jgi:hypothetical protein